MATESRAEQGQQAEGVTPGIEARDQVEAEADHQLLRQLNAVNQGLNTVTKILAELLIRTARESGIPGVTTTELRSVGHRLVSSGGDLTELGVKMTVTADEVERQAGQP